MALEDDVMAVGGDVEVADVKVRREIGELALGSGGEADGPEVFVLNRSLKEDE